MRQFDNMTTISKSIKTNQEYFQRSSIDNQQAVKMPNIYIRETKNNITVKTSNQITKPVYNLKTRDYNRVIADIRTLRTKSLSRRSDHLNTLNTMIKKAIMKSQDTPTNSKEKQYFKNTQSKEDSNSSIEENQLKNAHSNDQQYEHNSICLLKILNNCPADGLKSALKKRSDTVPRPPKYSNNITDISPKASILNIKENQIKRDSLKSNKTVQKKFSDCNTKNTEFTKYKDSILKTAKKVSFMSEDTIIKFKTNQSVSKVFKADRRKFFCGII